MVPGWVYYRGARAKRRRWFRRRYVPWDRVDDVVMRCVKFLGLALFAVMAGTILGLVIGTILESHGIFVIEVRPNGGNSP